MLTEEQILERRDYVGASDVPGILGVNPFRSPFDVWLEKNTATRPGTSGDTGEFSPRLLLGNLMEPALIRYYEKVYCRQAFPNSETFVFAANPLCRATPDGLIPAKRRVHRTRKHPSQWAIALIECKLVGFGAKKAWMNDDGNFVVPPYVEAQVQWQMGVCGVKSTVVICYTDVTTAPFIAQVSFDAELFDSVRGYVEAWWERHIVGDTPPGPSPIEDLPKYINARYSHVAPDDNILDADPDDQGLQNAVKTYFRLREQKAAVDGMLNAAEAVIKDRIGTATGIRSPHWGTITWAERPGSISYKSLAEKLSGGKLDDELIEEYRSASTRTFSVRRATPLPEWLSQEGEDNDTKN